MSMKFSYFNVIYMIIILLSLAFLTQLKGLSTPDITIKGLNATIYDDKKILDSFNINSFSKVCCVPNNLTVIRGSPGKNYSLPFTISMPSVLEILDITAKNYYSHQVMKLGIEYHYIHSKKQNFEVQHFCQVRSAADNYWTIVEVAIYLRNYRTVKFQYQFLCDPYFHPHRFDWGSVIMIILVTFFITLLSRFGKLYSFKILFRKIPRKLRKMDLVQNTGLVRQDEHIFQGFFLNLKISILYIVCAITGVILAIQFQRRVEYYEEWIVYIGACSMTLHFVDECLCQLKELKSKLLWRIRTRHLFSVTIAFIIMFTYTYFNKPWFVSDIISICMMGSLIKLYKIVSMKDAVCFLVPCMIADAVLITYVVFKIRYEWDSVAMKYFDTPLFFQIPYFENIYKKKCAWVSIMNIIFPGFFISLAHRFDACKQITVYEIISFTGLFIGLLGWILFQSSYSLPLPLSLFTYIPMVGCCAFIAWRRTEIKALWTGTFYDHILLEPFADKLQQRDSGNSVVSIGLFAKEIELQQMNKKENSSSGDLQSPLVRMSQNRLKINSGLFQGLLAKD